jgi:CBS domain containing-hemolysin-like protein
VILRAVSRRLTRAVVVIVIATNTVNVLGPILIGEQATAVFGSSVIGLLAAVLTLSTIIFSEIIPKALGTHYAPVIARGVAPVILACIYALYPVVIALEKLVSLFKIGMRPIGTEEQIRALVRIGGGAGHIRETEGELIHRVFGLNDRRAKDLMTPRKHVIALEEHLTIRQAVAEVSKHPHTRYPVYDRSLDKIKGIVMNHDLIDAVGQGREEEPVLGVLRDVLFVPDAMRSDALLMLFRRRHVHLAVVLDGQRMIGIVSLEDVLEELVGEIEDERDTGKILT